MESPERNMESPEGNMESLERDISLDTTEMKNNASSSKLRSGNQNHVHSQHTAHELLTIPKEPINNVFESPYDYDDQDKKFAFLKYSEIPLDVPVGVEAKMVQNVLWIGDPIKGWYPYNKETALDVLPEKVRTKKRQVYDKLRENYHREAEANIAKEHKLNEARKVVPDSYVVEEHYQSVTFNYLNFQAFLNYIYRECRCHQVVEGDKQCSCRMKCTVVHRFRYNIRVGAYLRLACKWDHEQFFPLTLGEYGPWCYLKDRPDEVEDSMKRRY